MGLWVTVECPSHCIQLLRYATVESTLMPQRGQAAHLVIPRPVLITRSGLGIVTQGQRVLAVAQGNGGWHSDST